MSRACADHPPLTQFSPPASLQISPRLSPQPPTSRKKKKKNHPKITSRPQRGPCQTFAFIAARTGGKSADGWQLFEGVEGGGCEGGQCHTKGGQEGKISHPWSVRQRSLFFLGGGGGDLLWSCEQIPLRTQHNTTQCRVSTVSCSPGDCKHYPNKEKHVNQEGYFKMCSDTVTNYLLQKCVICNVIHLSQNLLLVLVFFVRIYTCCHLLQTSSFIFEIVIRLVIHIFTKYML